MLTTDNSKEPNIPGFLRRGAATTPTTGRGRGRNVVPMNDPAKEQAKRTADKYFKDPKTTPEPEVAAKDPAPARVLPATDNRLLYRFLANVAAATTAKDLAVKKIRDLRKVAKSDGIDLRVADQVMKEMKLSPDELIAQENILNGYRLALRLPAHAPLELEGSVKRTAEEQLKHIELEGERAGLRGANQADNPHDLETAAGAAWQEGYDRGQEMLRGTMLKTMQRNAKKTSDPVVTAAPEAETGAGEDTELDGPEVDSTSDTEWSSSAPQQPADQE